LFGNGCTTSLGALLSGSVRAGAGGPDSGVPGTGCVVIGVLTGGAGCTVALGAACADRGVMGAGVMLLGSGIPGFQPAGASPGGTGGGGSGVGDRRSVTVPPKRDCHSASRRR
jgi:hypothetical protein